jgi:hypothetical protein
MITRQLSARIKRIEERMQPRSDGGFTMEELCRAMWRASPEHCLQIAQEPGEWMMSSYISMFEAEDRGRG